MEAGINADQNFYRRQFSPTSEDSQVRRNYETAQPPTFESRPPQLPPKVSLVTGNLQATVANGFGNGGSSPAPDDFYRGYRGIPSPPGYSDISTNGIMTATLAAASSRQPSSSFRSNSNGTTPKHPTISASRNALKPTYRSASAPIDERMALSTAKSTPTLKGPPKPQQPSVKDLLKRFDQNNDQTTPPARKPPNRTPISENGTNGPGYLRSRSAIPTPPSSSSSRAGQMTRDTTSTTAKTSLTTRTTQRSKFATEDQHSNNTLSSVPRTARTRQSISGNSQASQSMVNLSPAVPPKSSNQILNRKPLFGEVVPEESGPINAGYGITETRLRRTSDSSLNQPVWRHQRSQSDAEISPSSPTDWYRGATQPFLDDAGPKKIPQPSRQHNRAQSDSVGRKVSPANGSASTKRDVYKSPAQELKAPSQSRLPVSSRRSSTPSDYASPPSTRSTSPSSKLKTQKPDPRPWSPAGRAKTPTHRSPGRHDPNAAKALASNSSLKAYISAPPPKLSPPLRSSRPRLPVSSATTASSRNRATDRSGSPQPQNRFKSSRTGSGDTKSTSRVGIPGPVDFAAHRERIQKAYSRSIQESEAKEVRAAAELRQKAVEDGKTSTQRSTETVAETDIPPKSPNTPPIRVDDVQNLKLEVKTSFTSPQKKYSSSRHNADSTNLDSPTLGIPGSFPDSAGINSDEDEPQSAVTTATEIDNEPQTESPRNNRDLSHNHGSLDWNSTNAIPRKLSADSSLLTTNDNGSIRIILDTTSIVEDEENARDHEVMQNGDYDSQDLDSDNLTYGDPVFASTTSMPIMEVEEDLPAVETPRQPDGFVHEHDTPVANGVLPGAYLPDSPQYDVDSPEDPDELPQWEPETHTSSAFLLPMLETKLGDTPRSEISGTPVTEIDYESSDGVEEAVQSLDGQQELLAPDPYAQRASQQSAWTDYTVNTINDPSWEWRQNHSSSAPDFSSRDAAPEPPPKEDYAKPNVPPKPPNYSPLPSPRSVGNTPRITSPVHTFRQDYSLSSEHHSSDINRTSLHEGPAVPPIPAWPDHSPPPPPQGPFSEVISPQSSRSPPPASVYNRRPASSVYRSTRDSESRRESVDDLNSSRPSISTPISSARISLNDEAVPSQQSLIGQSKVDVSEGDKELTEKQAKRLQHRGNVIKELIDTESVYLKDMNVVEEIYKGTAEACPKLEPGDVKTIFRNTDHIVAFSTMFLDELKAASASVYSPRQKLKQSRNAPVSPSDERLSTTTTLVEESDYEKDRKTRVGEYFGRHLKDMQSVYTDFLKSSEQASIRLAALQADAAVKVWLSECNTVAKDLTAAWDLDALLIKPVQRITRYQLLLNQLLEATPEDHPDHRYLQTTYREVGGLLKSIDDLKKRIDTVNKIVGRKRKESDVRTGLAKAFGVKSRDKSLTSNTGRPADDETYVKMHEKFGDDYLRLQVVLRDVEFYTRQANTYVNDFLRYLSAIELVMRVSASPYPELESKWARFNMSMRDMGTVALEDHVTAVRKQVIEPFEQVIKAYGPPDLAMKKRRKRRLDYERWLVLKAGNKRVDDKLHELVEQYEALNETLKFELPKLSTLTEKMGNMCLVRFVSIQVQWYSIWQEKVKTVLEESQMPKDIEDIIDKFHRDYKYQQARIQELCIANGAFLEESPKGRLSHSTTATKDDDASTKSRKHPPTLESRPRGKSVSSDIGHSPSLPTPDFAKRLSEQFTFSPILPSAPPIPQFSTRDFPPMSGYSQPGSRSPAMHEFTTVSRPHSTRPNTGRSFDSGANPRRSVESGEPSKSPSSSAYYSASASHHLDSLPASARPFSGLFHSAMPVSDGFDDSQRSSRASSHERERTSGYNVLYLAASLFEFNISATKSEAGYPYLTYQAGEIFDVIGEKGELWLAKNQDDPTDQVGWIWSKHFARLATD